MHDIEQEVYTYDICRLQPRAGHSIICVTSVVFVSYCFSFILIGTGWCGMAFKWVHGMDGFAWVIVSLVLVMDL